MTARRFHIGDTVRTRAHGNGGHTRIPRYLRGRRGRIVALAGSFPLADDRARGVRDAQCTAVYSVRFDAVEVWGPECDANVTIAADLWESYLEPEHA